MISKSKNTFADVFFVEIFAFVKVFHILFDSKIRGLFSPNINFFQNAVIMPHLGSKMNSWQIVTVWIYPAGVGDNWYLYSSNSKSFRKVWRFQLLPSTNANSKIEGSRYTWAIDQQSPTQLPRKTTPLKHSEFTYGISLGTTSRRSLTSRQCCESRVSRLNESSPSSITNLTSSMPKREAETFYYSLVNSALADLPCTEFKFTTGNDLETSEVLLSVLFCIIEKTA